MTALRPASLPAELRTVRALLREDEAGFADIPACRENPVPGVRHLEPALTARTP